MLNRLKNAMATWAGDMPDPPSSNRRVDGRQKTPAGDLGGRFHGEKRTDARRKPAYNRPHFLHLNEEEVAASGDKTSRPIILPRDVTKVPWCAGYAEVINAGKSELNEDQARAERIVLLNPGPMTKNLKEQQYSKEVKKQVVPKTQGDIGSSNTTDSSKDANNLNKVDQKVESCPSFEDEHLKDGKLFDDDCTRESNSGQEKEKEKSDDSKEGKERVSGESTKSQDYVTLESDQIILTYFGIFDGHAGHGAALMASNELHMFIKKQLLSIMKILLSKSTRSGSQPGSETTTSNAVDLHSCCICHCHRHQMNQKSRAPVADANEMSGPMLFVDKLGEITLEELVVGAIEKAFFEMDKVISDAGRHYHDTLGGCTALAVLFFMGKLFIANAGDCRAVICQDGKAVPATFDFTPETERKRLYTMASLFPHLLYNEFTYHEFVRRPVRKDVGKELLCREAWMSGWSLRKVTEEDLRPPIVTGDGKRAKLLSTIGVTRGFGDHSLRVYESDICIKPFLTSVPDIKVIDMNRSSFSENDVLVMASDGLWDVISSDQAAVIVQNSLSTVEISNPKKKKVPTATLR